MTKISRKNAVMNATPALNVKAITDSTKNYFLKQGEKLTNDFITLVENHGDDPTYHDKLAKILQLMNRPAFTPKDQIEKALVGSGIKGYLNADKGTEHLLFLEGPVSVDIKLPVNHKIIPSDSPCGISLLGKKKGEIAVYKAIDKLFSFEITGLIPYSVVKEIFFPVDQEVLETKTEAEVIA